MKPNLTLVQPSDLQAVTKSAIAKSALINASAEVFGANGLEGATTRDIAQRAGQNISAIAYYFGNKEGLYLAVADHIAGVMNAHFGPLLLEITEFLEEPTLYKDSKCIEYFGRLLTTAAASNKDLVGVTAIIVREQMHPTDAFDVLYERALLPLQKVGARLMDAYSGPVEDPGESEETIVRFHAVLGQILVFRMTRATVIRRAGWTDIGPREEKLIQKVAAEQACDVLQSLRARRRKQKAR